MTISLFKTDEFGLHRVPDYRRLVRTTPASRQRGEGWDELNSHVKSEQLSEPLKQKIAQVLMEEMLPGFKQGNSDHVILDWYESYDGIDLHHERTQLKGAIAFALEIYANAQTLEDWHSKKSEILTDLNDNVTLSSKGLSFGGVKYRDGANTTSTVGKELSCAIETPLDESGKAYAKRALKIIETVTYFKAREEYLCANSELLTTLLSQQTDREMS